MWDSPDSNLSNAAAVDTVEEKKQNQKENDEKNSAETSAKVETAGEPAQQKQQKKKVLDRARIASKTFVSQQEQVQAVARASRHACPPSLLLHRQTQLSPRRCLSVCVD